MEEHLAWLDEKTGPGSSTLEGTLWIQNSVPVYAAAQPQVPSSLLLMRLSLICHLIATPGQIESSSAA